MKQLAKTQRSHGIRDKFGPNSWPTDFPSTKTGGRLQLQNFVPQSIRVIFRTRVENKTCSLQI